MDSSAGLGELSISLCHNPTDQKLTVKINSARSLQTIAHGKMSRYLEWFDDKGLSVAHQVNFHSRKVLRNSSREFLNWGFNSGREP